MAASSPSTPVDGAGAERPRVIYVMGAGRSGSTILGVTLGNCDGVVFAGELDKWPLRKGVPKLEGAEAARFWGEVLDRVPDAEELFAIRTHRYLERSSALLRPRRWLLARGLRGSYRRVNEQLYRAIAATAAATHVVDTGHYPLRARELQGVEGIELFILFLVRDPRSVVASFARTDAAERRFNPMTTNVYLWLTHLLGIATFLRQPRARRIFVSHEAFLANPDGVIREILTLTGSSAAVPELSSLGVGVPFVGNRLINSAVVALEQRPQRPPTRSALTAVMQAPLRLVLSLLRPAAGLSS
jgi:hypothetical protein